MTKWTCNLYKQYRLQLLCGYLFFQHSEFQAANECIAVQLQKEWGITKIFIIAAVLWHCASTLQSKCTVLCKQPSIFIWAEHLAVEVMYICTYACKLRKLRGGPLLYTYGMWQYNLSFRFYEMKRKQNNLFHCTKHPPCLDRTDGRF